MVRFLLSTVCVIGLGSLGISAQKSPDFSGTWTMDLTRSEAAAQGPPIGPVTVTIRQTPNEIQVDTTRDGTTLAVRYLPVGTTSTPPRELEGTFRWEQSKLITNLVTYINKQAVTFEEVRTLNPAGTEMTVDVTLVVQHGYQSFGSSVAQSKNAPNTSTGKNVFVRAR